MGAWGEGPFENDDAWDWLGSIEKPIVDTIQKALCAVRIELTTRQWTRRTHPPYHEAIAAAALLSILSQRRSIPALNYEAGRIGLFGYASDVLQHIDLDEKWIATWRDAGKIHFQLRRQIHLLIKLHDTTQPLRVSVRKRKRKLPSGRKRVTRR